MAETNVIQAELREVGGSADARRLRAQGRVPGVIYGEGKAATHIRLDAQEVSRELRRHTGENVMVAVAVGDQEGQMVLLKDVQHHPLTGLILHVDFQLVSLTTKLRVMVPVELAGEAVGVTLGGGIQEQLLREVEIECLPEDIPDVILADVSLLEIGQSLSVGDLVPADAGFTVTSAPDLVVANVSAPRVLGEEEEAEEAEEAAAGAAPLEPEVITEKSGDKEET